MPTNNPRVSITLSPGDLAILDRFAAASGAPRATILAGMVESVLPQLERAAEVMELANAAPRHVQESLAEGVRAATDQASGALQNAQDSYAGLMAKLQRELPIDRPGGGRAGRKGATAPGTARRVPKKGSRPPPTNRGVKS